MVIVLFENLTSKDKSQAVERLIKGSTPSQDFFFMIILSILTATLGLLLNSISVIIGSMLIAPMLYPILSLALGISVSDFKLISRSLFTVIKSFAYGVAIAGFATILFNYKSAAVTSEILLTIKPDLAHIAIAIVAGFAGSFALVKPQLNETLPGIAISVALIPPIAVVGIGMATINFVLMRGAIQLFLINALGITAASVITFTLMHFYVKRNEAKVAIKKEDTKVKLVEKRVENAHKK